MTGLVIRLGGVEQPETRIFHQQEITIGTAPSCDLSFRDEGLTLPASEVLLKLESTDGPFRVVELSPEANLLRDGEAIALGDAIRDGDTFNIGTTGVRLRFFFLTPTFELAESLQLGTAVLNRAEASTLSAKRTHAGPRTDVAIVFVKKLIRELAAEIPRRWLFLGLGLVSFAIIAIIYVNALNFIATRINTSQTKQLNDDVNSIKTQIEQMRKAISDNDSQIRNAQSALSLPTTLVTQYGAGVCLVYGLYSYVDPRSGREARYKDNNAYNSLLGPGGNPNISVEGIGPASDLEFLGTGFQVSPGMILTNRHVVQPWDDDPVTGILRNYGLRPRLKEIYAYFPKLPQPIMLHTIGVSTTVDVALCGFENAGIAPNLLPVLPLDDSEVNSTLSGQAMVLIGYPAGLEWLMARLDDKERRGLSLNRRTSLKAVLNTLAEREAISPLTTQGHIGNLSTSKIIHDAGTTDGGSGGPIFGLNGKVIGINQAVLDNSPAKFGVPIRYGIELMVKQKSGELNPPAQR